MKAQSPRDNEEIDESVREQVNLMAFVIKNQPEGKTYEARTYRALQVEWVCGSGESSPGNAAVVTLAPLCQDAVQVHSHTCL